jgi:hypothetical protein
MFHNSWIQGVSLFLVFVSIFALPSYVTRRRRLSWKLVFFIGLGTVSLWSGVIESGRASWGLVALFTTVWSFFVLFGSLLTRLSERGAPPPGRAMETLRKSTQNEK